MNLQFRIYINVKKEKKRNFINIYMMLKKNSNKKLKSCMYLNLHISYCNKLVWQTF